MMRNTVALLLRDNSKDDVFIYSLLFISELFGIANMSQERR